MSQGAPRGTAAGVHVKLVCWCRSSMSGPGFSREGSADSPQASARGLLNGQPIAKQPSLLQRLRQVARGYQAYRSRPPPASLMTGWRQVWQQAKDDHVRQVQYPSGYARRPWLRIARNTLLRTLCASPSQSTTRSTGTSRPQKTSWLLGPPLPHRCDTMMSCAGARQAAAWLPCWR